MGRVDCNYKKVVVDCMKVFHGVVVDNADKILKGIFEKRINTEKTPRPIWLTTEIKKEIFTKERDMLYLKKSKPCSLSVWT